MSDKLIEAIEKLIDEGPRHWKNMHATFHGDIPGYKMSEEKYDEIHKGWQSGRRDSRRFLSQLIRDVLVELGGVVRCDGRKSYHRGMGPL